MIRAGSPATVLFDELAQIQVIYYCIDKAYEILGTDQFVQRGRQQVAFPPHDGSV